MAPKTKEQLHTLLEVYRVDPQPSFLKRKEMSKTLSLSILCVSKWFAYRYKTLSNVAENRRLSVDQKIELDKIFEVDHEPSTEKRQKLAKSLSASLLAINKWFTTRRERPSNDDKKRRLIQRKWVTPFQKQELEDAFLVNKKPTTKELKTLSKQLNLHENFLDRWFNNRNDENFNSTTDKDELVSSRSFFRPDSLTTNQTNELKKAYEENNKRSSEELQVMASALQLTFEAVKYWFKTQKRHDISNKNTSRPDSFTQDIRDILSAAFEKNKYLTSQSIDELMVTTGLKRQQLKQWFTTRRVNMRSHTKRHNYKQIFNEIFKSSPCPTPEQVADINKSTGFSHSFIKKWWMRKTERDHEDEYNMVMDVHETSMSVRDLDGVILHIGDNVIAPSNVAKRKNSYRPLIGRIYYGSMISYFRDKYVWVCLHTGCTKRFYKPTNAYIHNKKKHSGVPVYPAEMAYRLNDPRIISVLQESFFLKSSPTNEDFIKLAQDLDVSVYFVVVWFHLQNAIQHIQPSYIINAGRRVFSSTTPVRQDEQHENDAEEDSDDEEVGYNHLHVDRSIQYNSRDVGPEDDLDGLYKLYFTPWGKDGELKGIAVGYTKLRDVRTAAANLWFNILHNGEFSCSYRYMWMFNQWQPVNEASTPFQIYAADEKTAKALKSWLRIRLLSIGTLKKQETIVRLHDYAEYLEEVIGDVQINYPPVTRIWIQYSNAEMREHIQDLNHTNPGINTRFVALYVV